MRKIQFFLFGLTVLNLAACSKDDGDETNNPAPTGAIAGSVRLEDEFGHVLGVSSGMTITSNTGLYGVTDDSGAFVVTGLEKGSYTLTYTKAGFGTYKRFNIAVEPEVGDGITSLTGTDVLAQSSSTVVTNLAVSLNPSDSTLTVSCDIGPNPSVTEPRSFRLFFGNSASVSYAQYEVTPPVSWSATTVSGVVTGIQRSLLYNAGFTKGSTAWVIAYGESARSNSYNDPVSGKKVFPNLNTSSPSNVFQFLVP